MYRKDVFDRSHIFPFFPSASGRGGKYASLPSISPWSHSGAPFTCKCLVKEGGGGIYIPPATETECRFPRTNLFSLFRMDQRKRNAPKSFVPCSNRRREGSLASLCKTHSSAAPAWQHMRCAGGRTLYYATNTWLPKKASQKESVGEEERVMPQPQLPFRAAESVRSASAPPSSPPPFIFFGRRHLPILL